MNTERSSVEKVFLATTALEEFWDTSLPIVFLGHGCLRYSRRHVWEKLGVRVVVGDAWADRRGVFEASDYLDALYERVLSALVAAMNSMHGVKHGERYWRIILGPWLQTYLSAVYDRYLSLRKALDEYPNLTTTVMPLDAIFTPGDTLEFIQYLKEDSYNLSIYSRILKFLGRSFPEKHVDITAPNLLFQEKKGKEGLKTLISKGMLAVGKASGKDRLIVLRNSYFTNAVELEICLKTSGRVWPSRARAFEMPPVEADRSKREALGRGLDCINEFERLLANMLPIDMPVVFVEGYGAVASAAESEYPSRPKAIFSSGAWYYDEPFKQWAAASSEEGVALLGTQHGGNYGSLLYHPYENHELAIVDRYFSWGWRREGVRTKVVPMTSTKLSGRIPMGADGRREGILFIATSSSRYLFQLPFTPVAFDDYLSWQERFVRALPGRMSKAMRVRLHREDFGWDMAERWKDMCPSAVIDSWDRTFYDSLVSCRLYVCDHLATTFIEALSANKPTILFWSPDITELRPQAMQFYDMLHVAGILYHSPEEAAAAISDCYDNVEGWWNDPVRQVARSEFCGQFALSSDDAIKRWIDEFRLMVKRDMKTTPSSVDG